MIHMTYIHTQHIIHIPFLNCKFLHTASISDKYSGGIFGFYAYKAVIWIQRKNDESIDTCDTKNQKKIFTHTVVLTKDKNTKVKI